MNSKKDYTKDILEEVSIRLQSWGDISKLETAQYKLLEEMIYNASGMHLSVTTLRRIFTKDTQPQMATCNALCAFLGYGNYANFILQKTGQHVSEQTDGKPEKQQDEHSQQAYEEPVSEETAEEKLAATEEEPATEVKSAPEATQHASRKRIGRRLMLYPTLVMCIGFILLLTANYSDTLRQNREKRLIERIVFQTSTIKGIAPFTTKITYDIPSQLLDDISLVCTESNGDAVTRTISDTKGELHFTFIYPGQGLCQLKYKDNVIRTLTIESRTPGWSAFLKEERNDLYLLFPFDKVDTKNGYLTIPSQEIPKEAISDQMFVSYTYYTDSIIHGDNFIFEAQVRNSGTLDHGIACYDIMLYAFGSTGMHGFALNKDCYSYLKFISSERSVTGIQQDLSHLNFDPAVWHIMKIETIDRRTRFYLDDKIILHMDYQNSVGAIDELTLRFKGCGAVKYVKVTDPKTGVVVFSKRFDQG